MRGKKIVTIYYVIVLALGITSLMLIRPEKPIETTKPAFKIKYRGEKFKPTDEVQFLSAKNYFKVAIHDLDLFGFMMLDAPANSALKDFFITVTEEAKKAGADYVHLTNVQRHIVTEAYGWHIGGANIGKSEIVIKKRFTYYFAFYRNKEEPKWPKDSGN
jgi:hypothetical protein